MLLEYLRKLLNPKAIEKPEINVGYCIKEEKTFCTICGAKNIVKRYVMPEFDSKTGKRIERYIIECPKNPCRHSGHLYPNWTWKRPAYEDNCVRCGRNKWGD
jgi:hypothetical protein